MKKRAAMTEDDVIEQPMAIYEVHLGSWMRHPNKEGVEAYYTYRQLADKLVKYVKDNLK